MKDFGSSGGKSAAKGWKGSGHIVLISAKIQKVVARSKGASTGQYLFNHRVHRGIHTEVKEV